MSFSIYVTIPHEDIPVPEDPGELNAWVAKNKNYLLFSEPLGGDYIVHKYWSSIANEIGLPIITAIYKAGISISDTEELDKLEKELCDLEKYWKTHKLEEPEIISSMREPLSNHLEERIGYLRKAIMIAKDKNAILGIS